MTAHRPRVAGRKSAGTAGGREAGAVDRQLGLLLGGVAATLVALAPLGERIAASLGACPFKALLGLPCLTCGATRTALALARLDFGAAIALNPLAAAGWTLLVAGGLAAGGAALAGRPLPLARASGAPPVALRVAIVAGAAANWVYLVVHGT